jgi:hypothetical protein
MSKGMDKIEDLMVSLGPENPQSRDAAMKQMKRHPSEQDSCGGEA